MQSGCHKNGRPCKFDCQYESKPHSLDCESNYRPMHRKLAQTHTRTKLTCQGSSVRTWNFPRHLRSFACRHNTTTHSSRAKHVQLKCQAPHSLSDLSCEQAQWIFVQMPSVRIALWHIQTTHCHLQKTGWVQNSFKMMANLSSFKADHKIYVTFLRSQIISKGGKILEYEQVIGERRTQKCCDP